MKHRNALDILAEVALHGCAIICVTILMTCVAILLLFLPYAPEFQVDSFSLSNLTFANGSRTFILSEIQLTARNPCMETFLNYDHIVTSIYYKQELLSQTGLSPFSQKPRNKTSLVAKFVGEWIFVEKWVEDEINAEIAENGSVRFNFWLVSSLNWDSKRWNYWSGRDTLRVFCEDLPVGIPSNGSSGVLTGRPRSCWVGEGNKRCNKRSPACLF